MYKRRLSPQLVSLVTDAAGTHVVEVRATTHLDSYGLLTLANATDACLQPVGRLDTHQGYGGERAEGVWVSS
jgi:hypothetical protein